MLQAKLPILVVIASLVSLREATLELIILHIITLRLRQLLFKKSEKILYLKAMVHLEIVILFLIGSAMQVYSTTMEIPNPLNGKHLLIHALEFPISLAVKRNATGHITHSSGILHEYIVVLSEKLNFTYSFLPINPNEILLPNIIAKTNFTNYLILQREVDYVLSSFIGTPYRNQIGDLPTYWFAGPFGFIVPYPSKTIDIKSTIKIFTFEVWVAIFGSILAMLLYFRLAFMNIFAPLQNENAPQVQPNMNQNVNSRINSFVLGNLVSQGQQCFSKRLFVRFAAGAWCLGCFFFVQIYSTTLVSHLMAPNQKPIANNLHELVNTPGLGVTMDFSFGLQQSLAEIPFGDYKKLRELIEKDRRLLCNQTEVCLKRVKEDRNVAYSAPVNPLKLIMEKDLQSSGECHFYLLKDTILFTPIYTMLQKHSPYTGRLNIEIQRCHQAGLFDKWSLKYEPNPRQCMELESDRNSGLRRLSLSHLTSAFVILGIGYSVSLIIFLVEKILHCPRRG